MMIFGFERASFLLQEIKPMVKNKTKWDNNLYLRLFFILGTILSFESLNSQKVESNALISEVNF